MRGYLPGLTLAVLALFAVMPLGLPAEERLWQAFPLLIAIFYWAVHSDDAVSERGAFLSGLTIDLLGGGPLGLWALLGLVTFACAVLARDATRFSAFARWFAFAISVIALGVAYVFVTAIILGTFSDPRNYLYAGGIALVLYPPLALVLSMIAGLRSKRPRTA